MEPKTYQIAGCDVAFPRQPYGVQLAFMAKLIKSIESKQNALLEAPTGCGKTLAILCAALAWQTKMKHAQGIDNIYSAEVDEHLQPSKGVSQESIKEDPEHIERGQLPEASSEGTTRTFPKVPTIYYCTRTHSQIGQVVQELKRTGYQPHMAYLGAKRHYCINPDVLGQKETPVEQTCDDLLNATAKKKDAVGGRGPNTGCRYYNGYQRAVQNASHKLGVHDIEDLSTFGRSHSACPYFVSRKLAEEAELVFCPYNYIVDPGIREATGIKLEGAVIIFDEGHNIEDVARDAGSIDVTKEELDTALKDASLAANQDSSDAQQLFCQVEGALIKLHGWLVRTCGDDRVVQRVESLRFQSVWDGSEIHEMLRSAGLDRGSVTHLKDVVSSLDTMMKADKSDDPRDSAPGGHGREEKRDKTGKWAVLLLKRLTTILSLMYDATAQDHMGPSAGSSFRLVLTRWKERSRGRARRNQAPQAEFGDFHMEFSLWCLDSACIFNTIGSSARSVIVTSGTLSPMTSFSSELGVGFGAVLEGAHVVPKEQVLAMSISRCPRNRTLKATFSESNSVAFQDGVGSSLLGIAQAVPDGMLVFMPSYTMMDKLCNRWQESELWNNLTAVKPVWTEPRGSEQLEATIQEYYSSIERGVGGMYIAVCRGKVSEGINFADANARAVVLVGIPYPAFKDAKVVEKKKFNSHTGNRARGLISGEDWYSLQAFRAMNQALGRCIRHKEDFGAIILLDERLHSRSIKRNLSRWLRDEIRDATSTTVACKMLKSFYQARLEKFRTEQLKAMKQEINQESKNDKVKLEVKLEIKCEDPSAPAVDDSAAKETTARQKWADNPKLKQLKISQVFPSGHLVRCRDPMGHMVNADGGDDGKPAPEKVMACDVKVECRSPPYCALPLCAAEPLQGLPDAQQLHGPTQPAESLTLNAWKQPSVCTRALQLLEHDSACRLTSAPTQAADATSAKHASVPEVTPCIRKRPRDGCGYTPADESSKVASTPPAGKGDERCSAAGGTLCRIEPADQEFLETGLAAFLEDDNIAQDAPVVVSTPACTYNQLWPCTSPEIPTQPYDLLPQQATRHCCAQQSIQTRRPREGASIHEDEARHTQAVICAGSQEGPHAFSPLDHAHREGHAHEPHDTHVAMHGFGPLGPTTVCTSLQQHWQSVWESACLQWFQIDCTTLSQMSGGTVQHSLPVVADTESRLAVASQLLEILDTALQYYQIGQLLQYLCSCTMVPCGIAIILQCAHIEPDLPQLECVDTHLIHRSLRLWLPDMHTCAARSMLSTWNVGDAIKRLRQSYSALSQLDDLRDS